MTRTLSGRVRSTLAAITAGALWLPAVAASAAPTTTADPTEAAAGWLATRFVDGQRLQTTFDGQSFDDAGLTADGVFALSAVGVAADVIASATGWLEDQATAYAGDGDEEAWAGAAAKLLLVATTTGRDAADFGGIDLVARLQSQETDAGRYADTSSFGDFSNVITQSLAVAALERASDTGASADAVTFLAGQACDDGGFPVQFDADPCRSDVDATGFAVQALLAAGATDTAAAAGDWLSSVQADTGSFGGEESPANANSTGLGAAALALLGEDEAAAEAGGWLVSLQQDCDGAHPGALPFARDDAGDVQRATAQALFGLARLDLTTVSAAGASSDVPTFDCPERFSDVAYGESVHAPAINELVRREVVQGQEGGIYAPAAALTRGQLASLVGRAIGVEQVAEDRFSDTDGNPHAGYVNALADRGIVEGHPDGTYRPSQPVGRDQMAAVLARWLELDPVEEDRFDDIAGNRHRQQINALAVIEVATGTADGRYLPGADLRRDQAASLVVRALRWLESDTDGGS